MVVPPHITRRALASRSPSRVCVCLGRCETYSRQEFGRNPKGDPTNVSTTVTTAYMACFESCGNATTLIKTTYTEYGKQTTTTGPISGSMTCAGKPILTTECRCTESLRGFSGAPARRIVRAHKLTISLRVVHARNLTRARARARNLTLRACSTYCFRTCT